MADYGSAAGASAGRVKTALEAAMIRHRRQLPRGRLFNDLSAKPDICNPMTAGSPTAGSQMGSQRRQAVTHAGRPTAPIGAGNWLIRRRPATVHDGLIAPCKRQVSGSNPLTGSQVNRGFAALSRKLRGTGRGTNVRFGRLENLTGRFCRRSLSFIPCTAYGSGLQDRPHQG
jgi:hypothetical protein